MARNALLLLVVLASACTVAELDLTTKSCPCPSGWECGPTNKCVRAGSVVDAGVDANCSLDQDDDAVDDCRDNCPAVANAQQHDEDGDARGDACDLCPGDVDDGANADGDGVGDACDPSPTTAERIALFEGFHAGIPTGWTVTGNWAHVGDDVVVTSGVDVIGNLAIVDPAPNGRSWLVGKLTVGTLHDPGSSTRYVSLLRKWDQAVDANVRCLLYQGTIGGATSFGIRDTGPVPGLSNLVPHPFATGQTERFELEQNGTAYRCTNGALVVTGTTAQTSAGAKIGLRTRSVSASYAWMMLIVPEGD